MSQQPITLFHYWRSSCSWRVRWALAIKGVTYESKPVNLLKGEQRSPEYLKLNPSGLVPCLMIDGVPSGESLAMLEWIEEKFPRRALLPQDPASRMRVRQMCLSVVAGTQPLQNLGVQNYYSDDPAKKFAWAKHWTINGMRAFDALIEPHAGTFCFGSQLTMADICLIPQCYNAVRYGVDLDQYPRLKRIYEHCLSLPECDAAAPHNQPGADVGVSK
jgi:maleylacetoacetate isomerase